MNDQDRLVAAIGAAQPERGEPRRIYFVRDPQGRKIGKFTLRPGLAKLALEVVRIFEAIAARASQAWLDETAAEFAAHAKRQRRLGLIRKASEMRARVGAK